MTQGDLLIILRVYLISLVWQLASWPLTSRYFKDLNDRGWAISRVLSTVLIALVMWQFGYFGFESNNNYWLLTLSAILMVMSLGIYKKKGFLSKEILKSSLKFIVLEEYLFIVGLSIMAITRGFMPDIHDLEKFMDFGFVNRYLIVNRVPATDMWFATDSINYYSFGHYWASILIRYLSISPAVGYNMVLALFMGMAMSITFSIVSNLIPKGDSAKFVGALVASMAVCIGGNSHALWYFLSHKFSLANYWYADATRFIYNTIHEFPGYSFVVSDLHGHLIDLPIVLTFLVLFVFWTTHKGWVEEVLMGLLVGIMIMTNTWDLAIYGLLMMVYCLFELFQKRTSLTSVIKSAVVIGLAAAVAAIPWWLSFIPISNGIAMVKTRSPIWQLLVLWSSGFISIILALISSKMNKNKLAVWAIGVTAVLLILIPELVYAKDIYPNHPRANTMFKLTYQGFIMMGICLGVAIGQMMEYKRGILRFLGIFTGMVIFSGSMLFPIEAFPAFYRDYKSYRGLNGEAWMSQDMPSRYTMVSYLRKNRDTKNMVEAVGDSYTNFNAISVFSGVPTVVGWRVHEWLWRGSYTPVGLRDGEVKEFYENNDNKKTAEFIKKYNVGWIVVGDDERSKYRVNEVKIRKLGEMVAKDGLTYLIKVK